MTNEEREALILSCLPFAWMQAKKYRGRGRSFDELLSDAYLGLIESADRYDPERETKFITCADFGIRKVVMEGFADRHRPLRIPRYVNDLVASIQAGKVTLDDIKPRRAEHVRSAMTVLGMAQSVDSPDEPRLLENVAGRESDPLDDAIAAESESSARSDAISLLDGLDERSRLVVNLHLGLDGEVPHSFRQVGKRIGCTKMTASNIYNAAIRSIKIRVKAEQRTCA